MRRAWLLALGVAASSCSSGDNDDDSTPTPEPGAYYEVEPNDASDSPNIATSNGDTFVIRGACGDGEDTVDVFVVTDSSASGIPVAAISLDWSSDDSAHGNAFLGWNPFNGAFDAEQLDPDVDHVDLQMDEACGEMLACSVILEINCGDDGQHVGPGFNYRAEVSIP